MFTLFNLVESTGLSQKIVYIGNISNRVTYQVWKLFEWVGCTRPTKINGSGNIVTNSIYCCGSEYSIVDF